jgi:hypothetical protein
MAIDFPSSPTTGDFYSLGDRRWRFNGTAWESVGLFFSRLLTVEPASPEVGDTYFDTVADLAFVWDGTGWLSMTSGAEIAALDTDDVAEGENLYFTDSRVDNRIAAASVSDLSDVNTTGAGAGDVLAFDGSEWVSDSDAVRSTTVSNIVTLTQAQYDDITTPDSATLYVIEG